MADEIEPRASASCCCRLFLSFMFSSPARRRVSTAYYYTVVICSPASLSRNGHVCSERVGRDDGSWVVMVSWTIHIHVEHNVGTEPKGWGLFMRRRIEMFFLELCLLYLETESPLLPLGAALLVAEYPLLTTRFIEVASKHTRSSDRVSTGGRELATQSPIWDTIIISAMRLCIPCRSGALVAGVNC